jgi:hypothetical protein
MQQILACTDVSNRYCYCVKNSTVHIAATCEQTAIHHTYHISHNIYNAYLNAVTATINVHNVLLIDNTSTVLWLHTTHCMCNMRCSLSWSQLWCTATTSQTITCCFIVEPCTLDSVYVTSIHHERYNKLSVGYWYAVYLVIQSISRESNMCFRSCCTLTMLLSVDCCIANSKQLCCCSNCY